MTREEAAKYIERLSYNEKQQLNDLLRALAQKRQPSASLRVSKKPDAKKVPRLTSSRPPGRGDFFRLSRP